MTKIYTHVLAELASKTLANSGVDVNQQVAIRPLAKAMLASAREQGLNPCYQTCKNHMARAVRRARGEVIQRNWGGPRPGSGRPRKGEE